jgi:hypothetical protein
MCVWLGGGGGGGPRYCVCVANWYARETVFVCVRARVHADVWTMRVFEWTLDEAHNDCERFRPA